MAVLPTTKSVVYQESRISYYGWVVAGMALLANLVAFGLVYSFGVFFKPLASEFGWSRATTGGAFAAYAIIHNILALLTGRLTDRFGIRIVAAVAGSCLGLSMILMSRVTALWELYIYYISFFSVGVAATYAPMMATVSRWFTERRGFAIGIAAAGVGMGGLVIAPLTAWLISYYGWRIAYIVLGTMSWVIFIPIVIFVKESSWDGRKAKGKEESCEDFTFVEALKTRTFVLLNFAWFFIAFAAWGLMVHIVPLFTDKGISLLKAGILAGIIGGGGVAGRISGGFFSDRMGRKQTLLISFALQLIMLFWLLILEESWIVLFAILFGLSYGGWGGIIAAFPADYFGIKATGIILGFFVFVGGLGAAFGSYVGGYIFDKTHSYHFMVVACVSATFISLMLALFIKRPTKS